MRNRRWFLWCLVFVVAACGCEGSSGCFQIEPGDCSRQSGEPAPILTIIGLPSSALDPASLNTNGFRATQHVVDQVTFYLVRGDYLNRSADTVRDVTWALADHASAQISRQADGGGRLVATAVGRVGRVMANQTTDLRSCGVFLGSDGCAAVASIDVVP
jgi:hypothetical protein